MNMLLEELENLTSKHPKIKEASTALYSLIDKNPNKVYLFQFTLERLLERLNLPHTFESLRIIELLIANKIIDKKVQVTSEKGGGLFSYSNFNEIPNTVYDQFIGEEVKVIPDNIKTIFTIHQFENVAK